MNQINQLISALTHICQDTFLDEKWLLAPTRRIGMQWIDQICANGQPVVNLRVKTLTGMLLELVSEDLLRLGVRLISSLDGVVILSRLWERHQAAEGYLWLLPPSLPLFQKVYSAINAMRMAGVAAEGLSLDFFENQTKGAELRVILQEYLAEAHAHHLIDYAGVVHLAIAKARQGRLQFPKVRVLIPSDLRCRGLEQEFLSCIGGHIATVPVDLPYPHQRKTMVTDLDLLQWLPVPAEAPPPKKDDTVRMLHAVGAVNEIREIFRRCVSERIPLDAVEIVCANPEEAIPLLFETSRALGMDAGLEQGVPLTYADGIPARYSRPGQALIAWLAWMRDQYAQPILVRLIQDGLVRLSDSSEYANETRLASWFRTVGIGIGRERYLPCLEAEIEAIQKQIAYHRASVEEDEVPHEVLAERLQKRAEDLRIVTNFVENLLRLTPSEESDQTTLLQSAEAFLEQVAHARDELDQNSRRGLLAEIRRMKGWVEREGSLPLDMMAWLMNLPQEAQILGMSPKEGHIHVSTVMHGGHSGREQLFVIGLDDSAFPGSGGTDPILLDEEREHLSPHLMTRTRRLREKVEEFYRMLCRQRGRVTLSFASNCLADDRECFPSPMLFAAYRVVSGHYEGDLTAMMQWLGKPVSFAPEQEERCLSAREWWLWRLCGTQPVEGGLAVAAQAYAHLGPGAAARQARESDDYTEYDGFVPQAGVVLNPARPDGGIVSASSLELLGRCPMAYFFQYGLKIEKPDELEIDETRWLDPLAYGTLLHELFERFMKEKLNSGQPVGFDEDFPQLQKLLKSLIQQYRELYPPPSESVYRKQVDELVQAARIFLKEEEQTARYATPVFLEASIGLPLDEGKAPTALDHQDPVTLDLGQGVGIRVRGKVDRIDRIGSKREYIVWDYKTGGTYKYQRKSKENAPPFNQGRVIQHLLYVLMVQQCLREKISPQAVVKKFGFFFPGVKGKGERLEWTPDELMAGLNILHTLTRIVATGAFIQTDSVEDCTSCDYRLICGDPEQIAQRSAAKLANDLNTRIRPFRDLRG
ncbi:MAG: PD-(D/E)XK nuclease family protein [bacterium]|jgi:ATP-dependent helicase/nuclease subunit B|nr:PD-(D/E)XK nuclease family protein [bacterium]